MYSINFTIHFIIISKYFLFTPFILKNTSKFKKIEQANLQSSLKKNI